MVRETESWQWLAEGVPALAMALLLGLFALVIVLLARPGDWGTQAVRLMPASDARESTGATLRVSGRSGAHAVARLQLENVPRQPGEPRRMVWLAREPVAAVWLQGPGWRSPPRRFFAPDADEGLVPGAYLFPLPDSAGGEIELHASGDVAVALKPHLIGEDDAIRLTQRTVALSMLVYAGTFSLALVAVALSWTVRERYFLSLATAAILSGLVFGACNGHLYTVPGLRLLGGLGERGLWGLSLACTAAVLALVSQVADRQRSSQQRLIQGMVLVLAISAMVLMAGVAQLARWGPYIVQAGLTLAGAAALFALSGAVWQRIPMALPALALSLLTLTALAARLMLQEGVGAVVAWTRYGYQLALLALLVVLGLGLIARIGSYREQRDRERNARVASERRMQREAGRTALTRVLQARLRELAPADVEWTAFRLMLEHLLPHVTAVSAAVIAHGYHGRDVLVTEPIDDRRLVEGLEGTRLLMLKRQSLSGRPLQHALAGDARRTIEAVVPVAVGAQGWGALLLQRVGGAEFDDDELATAAEFVRLTVLHANEAVATQALKRTAELDGLTGTLNRRSIDQWLARESGRRHGERTLSLLFIDIDHFKRINDLHGHACGDHCLRTIAAALRTGLRAQDVLGRYGGEEFIALLPDCDVATARGIAEALRISVEDCVVEWQGSRLRLSVSVGVATRAPGEQPAALVDRADRALYVAKREGRNRISVGPAVFPG